MAEQTLMAEDIINARKEAEKEKREIMEATLDSVLETWRKEARTTGRTNWFIAADDPKWAETFKLSKYPRPMMAEYMMLLKARGFKVEEKYVPEQEKGFWIFKKVVREAHWEFRVTASEKEKK